MEDTAPASELERRKQLRHPPAPRPRHRAAEVRGPDLLRHQGSRSACATTASRTTSTSCSSSWTAAHTLEDAQKAYETQFRPDRLKLEDLEGFAQQLLNGGLAQNESPRAGKQLFDSRKKKRRQEWMQTLTNILYIKIPIIDPDRLLKAHAPVARLDLLAAGSSCSASASCCGAIGLVGTHFDTFLDKLPDYHEFFSFKTVVYLWGALARGQGDPRVRPRPQLQEVRRRGPRDGLPAPVPVAGPVLQRLRRLDAAQQVASHHHQRRPASTSSWSSPPSPPSSGGTRRRSRSSTTCR